MKQVTKNILISVFPIHSNKMLFALSNNFHMQAISHLNLTVYMDECCSLEKKECMTRFCIFVNRFL